MDPPFYIFKEQKNTVGHTPFLTGNGGFLQNIIYGYFGVSIDVYDDVLTISPKPVPIDGISSSSLNGIHFRGTVFSVAATSQNVQLTLDDGSKPFLYILMFRFSRDNNCK